jgi:hypothetical protein
MKTKYILILLALFAFSASANKVLAEDTVCAQVIPCDDKGELLPGFSYDNECFSRFRSFCEALKEKTICRDSLDPLYQENSALYTKNQDLQAKLTKLKRSMKKLTKRKTR